MSRRLAEILVEGGAVTSRDLEEAIHRQVVYGGSLGTNLLEASVLTEASLLESLTAATGLPSAGPEVVKAIRSDVSNHFPRTMAESYRVVPCAYNDEAVSILADRVPGRDVVDAVASRFQRTVYTFITPEVRLHHAMNLLYGTVLLPRYQALLSRLDGTPVVVEPGKGDQQGEVLSWGQKLQAPKAQPKTFRSLLDLRLSLVALQEATERDAVISELMGALDVLYDTAALFVIHDSELQGWVCTPSSSPQGNFATLMLSLQEQSVFRTVHQTQGHYLGPLEKSPTHDHFLATFSRAYPRAALVAPMLIGNRMGMMLYADRGERGISSQRVAAALMLMQKAGASLQSIIVRLRREANLGATLGAEGDVTPAYQGGHAEVSSETMAASSELSVSENNAGLSEAAPASASVGVTPQAESQSSKATAATNADDEMSFADVVSEVSQADVSPGGSDASDGFGVTGSVNNAIDTMTGAPLPDALQKDRHIANSGRATDNAQKPTPAPIVEVDAATEALMAQLENSDPTQQQQALARALVLGTSLDGVIRQRFPGPVNVDPLTPAQAIPPLRMCSGLLALLAARGEEAGRLVSEFLDDDDPRRRFFALYFFMSIQYPAAIDAVARRLYDSEPQNRYIAAEALRVYRNEPAYNTILSAIRAQLRIPVLESQISAIQLLGLLRDPSSVPQLIPLLESPRKEVSEACLSSLKTICAVNFQTDIGQWSTWWNHHYNRPRVRWLLDGLRSEDSHLRVIANQELEMLTGLTAHFDAESTPERRARAIDVWENWYQSLPKQ